MIRYLDILAFSITCVNIKISSTSNANPDCSGTVILQLHSYFLLFDKKIVIT